MLKKAVSKAAASEEARRTLRYVEPLCTARTLFQHPANERRDMMLTAGRIFETDRLVNLERTVDSLNGQLREMQWELYRAKAKPLSMRLWRNLVSPKDGREF